LDSCSREKFKCCAIHFVSVQFLTMPSLVVSFTVHTLLALLGTDDEEFVKGDVLVSLLARPVPAVRTAPQYIARNTFCASLT